MDIEKAKEHIEKAWALIVEHSIQQPETIEWAHKKEMKWSEERKKIDSDLNELLKTRLPDELDVCGLVHRALHRLGDRHSRVTYDPYFKRYDDNDALMEKPWREQREIIEERQKKKQCQPPPEPPPDLRREFLYVDFHGQGDPNAILKMLQACSKDGTQGIVLDVRNNRGGHLTPMLYALLPLLIRGEDENVLYARCRDGTAKPVDIIKLIKEQIRDELPENYFNPRLLEMPVAIWCSGKTCSAGEAILLAFRGRKNTKSFGQPTGDRSTCTINNVSVLPNGARIDIVDSLMCDRMGNGKGGKVKPVERIEDRDDTSAYIRKTEEWFEKLKHQKRLKNAPSQAQRRKTTKENPNDLKL